MTRPPVKPPCGRCGHSWLQHQPATPDDPGCWNSRCLKDEDTRCREYSADPVASDVAPVGHAHPATAKTAAQVASLRAGTHRKALYDLIRAAGPAGMTDDEMEQATGRSHQALSATRNTLMNDGLVVDSLHRRPTRYGNDAIAWVVVGLPNS